MARPLHPHPGQSLHVGCPEGHGLSEALSAVEADSKEDESWRLFADNTSYKSLSDSFTAEESGLCLSQSPDSHLG